MKVDLENWNGKCPSCEASMVLRLHGHRDASDSGGGQGGDWLWLCEDCKKCRVYKHRNMDGRGAWGIDIKYDSLGFGWNERLNKDGSEVQSSNQKVKIVE